MCDTEREKKTGLPEENGVGVRNYSTFSPTRSDTYALYIYPLKRGGDEIVVYPLT